MLGEHFCNNLKERSAGMRKFMVHTCVVRLGSGDATIAPNISVPVDSGIM